MPLIYKASRIIKMVILVDLSAIFGISTVNFSPFQGPNRFDALLLQSGKIFQYHNEYRMLSSFVRTRPVKFHQLLIRLQKTLMTLAVYTVNRIFLEGFVDQTTRKYTFQAFTSFHLTHCKWPERPFPNELLEIDTSIPETQVSAISILPVTLAPLTGFHAPKRRDICATEIRVLLLSVRVISNHPITNYPNKISESISLAICFPSCFFVNVCRSNHTRMSPSSSRELAYTLVTRSN